jgi:phosphoribosylformylglycinamidine synthase
VSAHDCSDGGLAVALAECCIAGGRGATVALAGPASSARRDALFGEAIGRVVLSLRPEAMSALAEIARRVAVPVQVIGSVGGDRLMISADHAPAGGARRSDAPWLDVAVADLRAAWEGEGGPRDAAR